MRLSWSWLEGDILELDVLIRVVLVWRRVGHGGRECADDEVGECEGFVPRRVKQRKVEEGSIWKSQRKGCLRGQ
jgi:hypothetical protein